MSRVARGDHLGQLGVQALGAWLVARHDLHLAAAQAGGDLERREVAELALGHAQRLRDLRLGDPEQPQHALLVGRAPADRRPELLRLGRLPPHRVQLARRAGQHDHCGPGAVERGHHQARRRPRGRDHARSLGHHRLLAVGGADRLEVQVRPALHQRAQDVGDPGLELGVEKQRPAHEAGHHLDGQVVGGRAEPAAGQDQVDALLGHEPQLGLHVLGAVAADGDVGEVDAQLAQAVGQPRPVAVLHPAGQDLGPGDDDARAGGHQARQARLGRTRWPASSGCTFVGVTS